MRTLYVAFIAKLWYLWHLKLRHVYDRFYPRSSVLESRPWWQLCCNGNAGGWRTRFCDKLENYWRSNS